MWMACTNRDTIKVAASIGVGALAFSFLDPEEAKTWSEIYYGIIKSEECVPIGHAVNANLAMVSNFSVHPTARRRSGAGRRVRVLLLCRQRAGGATTPSRAARSLFADFQKSRAASDDEIVAARRRPRATPTASARRTTSASTSRASRTPASTR
jgi:hypothetical protein